MRRLLQIWFLISSGLVSAYTKDTINVAVFTYEGVELLDFGGPGEVFAAASYYTNTYHFNVYTVARESQLTSQGFLKITPNYSFNSAPKSDVLVLPGGNSGDAINNTTTQNWIRAQITHASDILTVCSGIYFLEGLHELEGLQVTSHHKILPHLRAILGDQNVISEVKYVDTGRIVTSAGVSSGIEGALLLVAKIAGYEVANRTARYMEYPQWDISNGKITYDVQDNANQYLATGVEKPHFGVLDVAGHLALREGKVNEALNCFKRNSQYFPKSALAYYGMAKALKHHQEWVPETYEDFLNVLRNQGARNGKILYNRARLAHPKWILFTRKDIQIRGMNLFHEERYGEAELIFEMGVDTYSDDELLWVHLIKSQLRLKKIKKAKSTYQQAVKNFPENEEVQQLNPLINVK